MSIALLCISAYSASAQENVRTGKAFIYCTVNFKSSIFNKENKINNYTYKSKEWEHTMTIDCRQHDSSINGSKITVTDENGNNVKFSSIMAGLNWLGMMGWELMPYPLAYDTDGFIPQEYWLRLDVTGLSTDEINQKLSAFKNCQ